MHSRAAKLTPTVVVTLAAAAGGCAAQRAASPRPAGVGPANGASCPVTHPAGPRPPRVARMNLVPRRRR
jgi:hypothetical protein